MRGEGRPGPRPLAPRLCPAEGRGRPAVRGVVGAGPARNGAAGTPCPRPLPVLLPPARGRGPEGGLAVFRHVLRQGGGLRPPAADLGGAAPPLAPAVLR